MPADRKLLQRVFYVLTGACMCWLSFSSCFIDDRVPPENIKPPETCGNGRCESGTETCVNCAKDCTCCTGILVQGSAANPQYAQGIEDGRVARLVALSQLTIALGRPLNPLSAGGKDFSLIGNVTSQSATKHTGLCTSSVGTSGAFRVSASEDGSQWSEVGYWTADQSDFSLSCGRVKRAQWIRLEGQVGAAAELDAIVGHTCTK